MKLGGSGTLAEPFPPKPKGMHRKTYIRLYAYVSDTGNPGIVSVIDTATNTVGATIPVGLLPQPVAITPDGTRAYVSNLGDSTVSVIDTASNSVIATISRLPRTS